MPKKSRKNPFFDQHSVWHVFASHHFIHLEFHQHLHISFQSFQKFVGLLNNSLLVDQEMASLCGGAIIPEMCVYITLQYLSGGSYMDIFFLIGISKSSFLSTMEDNHRCNYEYRHQINFIEMEQNTHPAHVTMGRVGATAITCT